MRRFRAIVIAVAVVANLVMAIPSAKVDEEEFSNPDYRKGDVENWYRWTGGFGMAFEPFRQATLRAMSGYAGAVKLLRSPFQPVFTFLSVNQQWGLFAVVGQSADRLVVEVRRDGEWEVLYKKLDREHDWNDDVLRYRRIRGVWDSVKDEPKGTYKRFTVWVAKDIFAQQPDVDRVRVYLEKWSLSLPWEEVDPTITRRAERYHRRDELMKPPSTPDTEGRP